MSSRLLLVNRQAKIETKRPVDLIKDGRLFFEDVESLTSLEREALGGKYIRGIEYPNEKLQLDDLKLPLNLLILINPLPVLMAGLFPEKWNTARG